MNVCDYCGSLVEFICDNPECSINVAREIPVPMTLEDYRRKLKIKDEWIRKYRELKRISFIDDYSMEDFSDFLIDNIQERDEKLHKVLQLAEKSLELNNQLVVYFDSIGV